MCCHRLLHDMQLLISRNLFHPDNQNNLPVGSTMKMHSALRQNVSNINRNHHRINCPTECSSSKILLPREKTHYLFLHFLCKAGSTIYRNGTGAQNLAYPPVSFFYKQRFLRHACPNYAIFFSALSLHVHFWIRIAPCSLLQSSLISIPATAFDNPTFVIAV